MKKILEKYDIEKFKGFNWLNFDYLPDSKGSKFELYFDESRDLTSKFILLFYSLFKPFLGEILIQTFRPEGIWGNFCIDVWDFDSDKYDYSFHNKSEPTSNFLKMLSENEIEPEYSGYCRCLDWDKFLPIILNCIISHKAPYSLMFYIPNQKLVFYFHHTASFGFYYKELSEGVKYIMERIEIENLDIKHVKAVD